MATHQIEYAGDSDRHLWDGYVGRHPDASVYHLFGWRDVIHRTYGHKTHYLMAVRGEPITAVMGAAAPSLPAKNIVGILPVVHHRHVMFGNALVSLPFLDGGGILADCVEAEESLLSEAVRLGLRLGATTMELRCERALASIDHIISADSAGRLAPMRAARRSNKVRMLKSLPGTQDALVGSFKSKLRSQINRPLKEGCTTKVGGAELLKDFYTVFLINMRDLGSPVHSVELMRQVLDQFPQRSRIFVVYKSEEPVAAALVVGSGKVLHNPWASSLRRYASLSPNMLLYMRMLEYACDNGYQIFDFGRSTIGEGTYKFKEQWGAVPVPLCWYYISLDGRPVDWDRSGTQRFETATHCWRKLPLVVTKILGPSIRKHISL